MYLLLMTLAGASALLFLVLQWAPRAGDERAQQDAALAQLQQYQTFLYVSRSFFASTAAPSTTTSYVWSDIRAAAIPSMNAAAIPPHWKAVRRPDGYWVACTELAEATLAKLPALFPEPDPAVAALLALSVPSGSITAVTGAGGGSQGASPGYVVLGQQGGEAAGSANLCGGN